MGDEQFEHPVSAKEDLSGGKSLGQGGQLPTPTKKGVGEATFVTTITFNLLYMRYKSAHLIY